MQTFIDTIEFGVDADDPTYHDLRKLVDRHLDHIAPTIVFGQRHDWPRSLDGAQALGFQLARPLSAAPERLVATIQMQIVPGNDPIVRSLDAVSVVSVGVGA